MASHPSAPKNRSEHKRRTSLPDLVGAGGAGERILRADTARRRRVLKGLGRREFRHGDGNGSGGDGRNERLEGRSREGGRDSGGSGEVEIEQTRERIADSNRYVNYNVR